jgi:UDP-N-acetylmuramoyl-tripeptide--D-alanyl-D-alanine ligase
MIWALFLSSLLAAAASLIRWWRVAQREHYLPPAASRFAVRWWMSGWANRGLFVVSLAGIVGASFNPWFAFFTIVAQAGPVGLSLRGRTSPLAWTSRMKRVAVLSGLLSLIVLVAGFAFENAALGALGLVAIPVLVDVSLLALARLEARIGDRWVQKARDRLESSGARVVAITGSFGKTTTKQYLLHLLSPSLRTVASPASFNNRMGLARAINEGLVPGTEVFVAEMGTYGKGEIADLCRWIPPDVGAMVAVGPVHLERFRTEEKIVAAKSEILDRAGVGVISVDHPLLAALAAERADSMEVITISGEGRPAGVSYDPDTQRLSVADREVGVVPDGVFPTNLAAAVAIAGALGVEADPALFETLPLAEHRQTELVGSSGFKIIDDTFNSNPAGASRALDRLSAAASGGKRVVVTPGMVELGPLQPSANEKFARQAARVSDHLIVVGATNRDALLRGSDNGPASVSVVANRDEAVEWVRENLSAGDAVLYENDLPDHYP